MQTSHSFIVSVVVGLVGVGLRMKFPNNPFVGDILLYIALFLLVATWIHLRVYAPRLSKFRDEINKIIKLANDALFNGDENFDFRAWHSKASAFLFRHLGLTTQMKFRDIMSLDRGSFFEIGHFFVDALRAIRDEVKEENLTKFDFLERLRQ